MLHNRDVLVSLVIADYQGDGELSALAEDIRREVINSVEAMASIGDSTPGSGCFGGDQASVSVGALFGLVLGTILLQNWIFGADLARANEDALVMGIVAMVMHGLRGGESTTLVEATASTRRN